MAHRAALVSLNQTLVRLSKFSRISTLRDTIRFTRKEVMSLEKVLDRFDGRSWSERVDALDERIREAAYKLEDVVDWQGLGNEGCSMDVEEVTQEMNSFVEVVKRMVEEYNEELGNPLHEGQDGDAVESSAMDVGGKDSKIFGISDDQLAKLKGEIMKRNRYELRVISLYGMPGSGRSIIGKSVFDDPDASKYFQQRAWVTVGPKYQIKEILVAIISQLDPECNDKLLSGGDDDDEKLGEHLYTSLKGTRYLIALENVWDVQIWEYLSRLFPNEHNGSAVLLATSLLEVAQFDFYFDVVPFSITDEESWELLRRLVFDKERRVRQKASIEKLCPPELEKAGKKIAENCEGLLLEIAIVAFLLSKAEKTPAIWNKVAEVKDISVLIHEQEEILELSKITEDLELGNSFHAGTGTNVLSEADSDRKWIDLLGLSYLHERVKMKLFMYNYRYGLMTVTVLSGMAGIGKTTLAKKLFEDPSILCHFDHRVWVTLGPKYPSTKILEDILAQIDPDIDKMRMKGDELLAKCLYTILSYKRCLIVLDDIWNDEPLDVLYELFKDIKFEVLLTTRIKDIADCFNKESYEMQLLNKEESWCLLREKVFAENFCPPELEKAGKMIAENCDGLPLMIITVASLLSKAEKTPEFWDKVAKKENLVLEHANDKILKVLLPSYNYLPQDLKALFLYMGVFPQNYEIPTSKLFKLWYYDGILAQGLLDIDSGMGRLKGLVSRNLLMVGKKSYDFQIKTCSVHSVFWHLCIKEARKTKFFHVLNRLADALEESIKSQRRLCIQNSILFGIRTVYNSIASISTIHSLLCTGPPHQYPVPICFGLRLLRVLDALSIRFYEFPIQVLDLVYLRYFAFTYDGKLPPSTSKLRNLECLIVHQYHCTKLYGTPSYLPSEIWYMQQLKHLQVMGSILPCPCGSILPKLKILLDVSAHNCTKSVLEGVPNLEKLGIQIELRPDAIEQFSCFDQISRLCKLESLKCVVMNPIHELLSEVVRPPPPLSMSQSSLKKLSLSGLGYPWENMRTIALLPNLEVLKLRCYAFRGPEWVMHKGEFSSLCCLLLEDTDLVYWRAEDGYNRSLECLIIRNCYKLMKIPLECLRRGTVLELVDCNPSASEEILDLEVALRDAHVHSSWEC